MIAKLRLVPSLVVIAALSGCSLLGETESWLQAEIIHAEAADSFFGDGFFTLSSRHDGVTRTFTISASEPGSVGSSLLLVIAAEKRPTVGAYAIVPKTETLSTTEFSGLFLEELPGGARLFAAEEGRVEITRSGRNLVEGAFEFTAVVYCQVSDNPPATEGPCTPTQAPYSDEHAQRVTVEGSFSVVDGGNKAFFSRRQSPR